MKNKYTYIFLLLIVLLCTCLMTFYMNIEYFLDDYDNTTYNYPNKYLKNLENNIVFTLAKYGHIELATKEDITFLSDSPFLLNLTSQILEKSENETKIDIETSTEKNLINIYRTTKYGCPAIYMNGANNGLLIFTLDEKNIFYQKYLEGESCPTYDLTETDNIEDVKDKVNEKMKSLGIVDNFSFNITSIRKADTHEYRYNAGLIYIIEDYEHNINITYNYSCDSIYTFRANFQD